MNEITPTPISSELARATFYAHYKSQNEPVAAGVIRFANDSPGLLAVYTLDGWDFDRRRERAAPIADRLADDRV